jgi:hypothetical protein
MQIRFIACGYPLPFTICKRVVDSLLKCFSRIVDTSVSDPHPFYADPDPTQKLNADPDSCLDKIE